MGVIDLDALRAARGELEDREVIFHGQPFKLPSEMPYDVGDAWSRNDAKTGINMLLDEQAEAFWSMRPSVNDVEAFIKALVLEYGFENAGELSASNGSSPRTLSRSRPTSRASTA